MDTMDSIEAGAASTDLGLWREDEVQIETAEGVTDLMAGLTVSQMAAFEVLTSGGTIAAVALAARRSRKTIYEWLETGHPFAVAYEQWKRSIAETSRTRLLMIGEAATVTIAKSIKQGDTRAAPAVVKGMGLLSPPPVGPSMTQSVARKKEAEAEKAEEEVLSFKELVSVEDEFGIRNQKPEIRMKSQ